MINLAPLYYLNIMKERGGPVEKFKTSKVNIDFFRKGHKTLVKLNPLIVSKRPVLSLYSDWDGTGSDEYFKVSFYKAVSEALERWSFYELSNSCLYGLDIDASTNGFASFPSLFPKQARENAYLEAFERWSLLNWWDKRIGSRKLSLTPGIESFVIEDSSLGLVTVVHWKACFNGEFSYGFGSARSVEQASQRALIELKRNYDLLSNITDEKRDKVLEEGHLIERRLLYFSSTIGHLHFKERVEEKVLQKNTPRLIVDSLVEGPWLKYAKVWRCLFQPIAIDSDKKDDCFLF